MKLFSQPTEEGSLLKSLVGPGLITWRVDLILGTKLRWNICHQPDIAQLWFLHAQQKLGNDLFFRTKGHLCCLQLHWKILNKNYQTKFWVCFPSWRLAWVFTLVSPKNCHGIYHLFILHVYKWFVTCAGDFVEAHIFPLCQLIHFCLFGTKNTDYMNGWRQKLQAVCHLQAIYWCVLQLLTVHTGSEVWQRHCHIHMHGCLLGHGCSPWFTASADTVSQAPEWSAFAWPYSLCQD